jgi:hypothetical protein
MRLVARIAHRWLSVAALCVLTIGCAAAAQQTTTRPSVAPRSRGTVPTRLADSTFWRLMTEYSEPWGTFRSENFVSNETSLQWVLPELSRRAPTGGVYMGVAPDQNFTYITALQPSIAFIVDIRHQNAMQHLMYKALLEMSKDRAEFLARLFSRAPLEGVDTTSSINVLFEALRKQSPDSARYRDNLRAITDRLVGVHRFALSDSERTSLGCVYGAFFSQGPDLNYSYSSECRNPGQYGYGGFGGPGPGRGGFWMPTYQAMVAETDSAGKNWSYLGTESAFRALKSMEERNLIVPLTGNFAGPTAVRAVGQWARDHGTKVTTFYLSNVEQYLFQQDEAQRFYENVATLPIDSTSMFIRSFAGGRFMGVDSTLKLRPQSAAGRSLQLVSSIEETLKAYRDGKLASWFQVIGVSHQ